MRVRTLVLHERTPCFPSTNLIETTSGITACKDMQFDFDNAEVIVRKTLESSLFIIQIPVCCYHFIMHLFCYFFTLFTVYVFIHLRLFDHSSKARKRFNYFSMFNSSCSSIFNRYYYCLLLVLNAL